ncbi:MAG: hypothetical protein U9N77_17000 [Thermodesulfobacteriota bacterium]|nr:hypothetical protein [Thermodesulfobacteriota bacterium]
MKSCIAPDFVLSQIHKRALDGSGKPLGKSPLQESKIMTAEQCAGMTLNAMEKRERLLITGTAGAWYSHRPQYPKGQKPKNGSKTRSQLHDFK